MGRRSARCGIRRAALLCGLYLAAGCANDPVSRDDADALPADAGTKDATTPLGADVNTHRLSLRMRQGDGISLVNDYGDVRVRASGDSGLHYAGVVQKLGDENRAPEFRSERMPEKFQIRVEAQADWHGRVDAGTRVPAQSPLDLHTKDGLIEVRTGNNDVVATSTGGRFSIRTEGRIEARGKTGDMLIVVMGTDFGDAGAGVVETEVGNVELWIKPDANLTLHASAGGGVTVDAGDDGQVVQSSATAARVSFGDGSATFTVTSDRGTLLVQALPRVGED